MITESDLAEHLRRLEAELVSPDVWRSRAELEPRTTSDFGEFASAGRMYDRSALIAALLGREPPSIQVKDFTVRKLARRSRRYAPMVFGALLAVA